MKFDFDVGWLTPTTCNNLMKVLIEEVIADWILYRRLDIVFNSSILHLLNYHYIFEKKTPKYFIENVSFNSRQTHTSLQSDLCNLQRKLKGGWLVTVVVNSTSFVFFLLTDSVNLFHLILILTCNYNYCVIRRANQFWFKIFDFSHVGDTCIS